MSIYILLIEDNPGDAVIFREKLNASDLDYKLATAKRLSEGLDRISDVDFDIVLVDLSLPDTQGLEAVSRVRETAPEIPLIVLTGLDDATTAAEAKKLGAVDYIVKWYVDSVSLARYIRYAIAQYKMFSDGDAGNGAVPLSRRNRPSRVGTRVVEGEQFESRGGAAPKAGHAATHVAAEPEPETSRREQAGRRGEERRVHDAIEAAGAALLVVDEGGGVVFASTAAKRWVPDDAYPWPLQLGSKRVSGPGGTAIEQALSPTTWAGAGAYLVQLREASGAAVASTGDAGAAMSVLEQAIEAALTHVESAAQQSLWMADVLRSTHDLQRVLMDQVEMRMEDVDVLDIAQQVARDERDLAMSYGLPLRCASDRKKAISYADRNLIHTMMHRLVVDAVHASGSDGVVVNVEVEKRHTAVQVTWSEGSRAVDPAVQACTRLGRQVVEHAATLVDGESEYTRAADGRHVFSVHIPCRTTDDA